MGSPCGCPLFYLKYNSPIEYIFLHQSFYIMRISLLIIFLFVLSSNCFSQSNPDLIKNIYTIRDSRDITKLDLITTGLKSDDNNIVHNCLYALADMGDTSVVNDISELMYSSTSDYTKIICAYVLGQLPSSASVNSLESALDKFDGKNELQSEVINALGKSGNKNSLEKISNIKNTDPLVNIAIGVSIGRFGARKIYSESSVAKLKELTLANDLGVNRASGYGFLRTADAKLLQSAREQIFSILKNNNDAVLRAWGFSVAARFKDEEALKTNVEYKKDNDDWKVKVARMNALGSFDLNLFSQYSSRISQILQSEMSSSNGNVQTAARDASGNIFSKYSSKEGSEISSVLLTLLSKTSEPYSVRSSALLNYAKIKKQDAKQTVMKILSSDPDFDVRRAAIDACVNLNDPLIFKEVRDTITKVVQRYADSHPDMSREIIGSNDLAKLYRGYTGLLTNYIRTPDANDQNTLRLIFGEFLSSKDAEIVSNCIQGLSDSLYTNNTAWNDEDKLILDFEFKALKMPEDFDVLTSFIDAAGDMKVTSLVPDLVKLLSYPDYMIAKKSSEALKKLTGDDFPLNNLSLIDPDKINRAMEMLNEKYNAEIITSKGKITIELFPGIAPFTVLNFIDLANKNFYNGTIFHRVVPNFVIQGGDNTGTGFGSPGYSIRSEFSSLTYSTGVVGMASSGKDTEGSQFFITHSPQYHLDGKYTIFGFVTKGMDVVDKIIVGDKIESVKIIKK